MESLFSLLRFLIPGGLFIVVLIFEFLLIDVEWLSKVLSETQTGGLADLIGGFIVLLTVGFLSSMTYRLKHRIHGIDHVACVNHMLRSELIFVNDLDGRVVKKLDETDQLSKIDAYQIMTILWHQNLHLFDSKRGDFQGHLLNAFGSARVAVWFALITGTVIFFTSIDDPSNPLGYLLFFLVTFVLIIGIRKSWEGAKELYCEWLESAVVSNIRTRTDSSPITKNKLNASLEMVREIYYFKQRSRFVI